MVRPTKAAPCGTPIPKGRSLNRGTKYVRAEIRDTYLRYMSRIPGTIPYLNSGSGLTFTVLVAMSLPSTFRVTL